MLLILLYNPIEQISQLIVDFQTLNCAVSKYQVSWEENFLDHNSAVLQIHKYKQGEKEITSNKKRFLPCSIVAT